MVQLLINTPKFLSHAKHTMSEAKFAAALSPFAALFVANTTKPLMFEDDLQQRSVLAVVFVCVYV